MTKTNQSIYSNQKCTLVLNLYFWSSDIICHLRDVLLYALCPMPYALFARNPQPATRTLTP